MNTTTFATPIAKATSPEYLRALVAYLEALDPDQLTDELVALWEAATLRLEALGLEAERQAAEEAKKAEATAATIKAVEAKMAARKKAEFEAKVGPAAVAALASIRAHLANGNDGGVVSAYFDFKKKSRVWVKLPAELRKGVRDAFARHDAKKASRLRKK